MLQTYGIFDWDNGMMREIPSFVRFPLGNTGCAGSSRFSDVAILRTQRRRRLDRLPPDCSELLPVNEKKRPFDSMSAL